ncbi:gamma-glutamyltransferase [Streptomyces enissocaesilis]|uniref:gamma-glutamyltransferase n=1 Tax=Streptomyces enissocaesilis TaxID=332589 RepID=UPI0031DCA009
MVSTVRTPPVDPAATRVVRAGDLTTRDLKAYRALSQAPTKVSCRGLEVYGIAPSSSGGTSVGEALGISESSDLSKASETQYLHHLIEASLHGGTPGHSRLWRCPGRRSCLHGRRHRLRRHRQPTPRRDPGHPPEPSRSATRLAHSPPGHP